MRKWALRLLRVAYVGLIVSLPVAAVANYAGTQGAGTNFGSIIIGGVHFVSMLFCDATVANQCASVSAGGAVKVDNSAVTQPVSSATLSTAANQTSQITQETATAAAAGTTADAAWTSGNGTLIAILKSIAGSAAASLPTGGNTIGGVFGAPNVTPTDCSLAITTGGTAQNIIAASSTIHGFTLANIDTTAGSGEPVWFSITTTAAASTIASYPLSAPTATTFAGVSSYTTPFGFGNNHAVSVIAATTGHKISCTTW